jgi:tetratricopeptide (TPR) repeat protein
MGFSMVTLIGAVGLMTYHKSQEDNVDKMLTNARFALKYQMYDQVLKDANAVIDVCQTKPEAYVDRGFAYLAQNQQRYALSDFEKALTFNPNDTKVLIGHGQALLAMSMYPEAEADFKKAISIAAKEPEPYRQLAKLYVARHDFKKATQYSQKALQLAGNNATADDFETIAAIEYGAGNYAQAAASYEAALQKDPHRQPDLIREGECYRKLGNPAKALEAYNRAIILDPASAASYSAAGQCYMDMKKYSRAAASFTAVVTRQPQDRDALANRAASYMELKQYGHAIDDFDALLKLNPNDTAISNKRQMAVAKMSTTTKLAQEDAPTPTSSSSSTEMEGLTEKIKTDEPAVVEIARRMISNGETEGAVTVLAMCVRAKPNDAGARRYLAHALSDTGQAATAVQQFDVLLKISMLTGEDRLTYARALESAGRTPDALRQLKILTLVRPSDDQVWTELVQTYLNANMPDAAKLAANEAMAKVQTQAARESINALINGNGSNGNTNTNPNTNTPKKEIHVRA